MKRLIALILALGMLMLSGCTQVEQSSVSGPPPTLGPAEAPYDAPLDTMAMSYTSSVPLYLPSLDGSRLLSENVSVDLIHGEDPCSAIVHALLSFRGNDAVSALGAGTTLHTLSRYPVEISGSSCTVNLEASALSLEPQDLYTVALSLASTLGAVTPVRAVNVLVNDRPVGLDLADILPMGSVSAHPGEDLAVLWEQMSARKTPLGEDASVIPLTANVTLYFPTSDGTGFLPEVRSVTFSGQSTPVLAQGIIAALSNGSQYLDHVIAMPDLTSLMTQTPSVTELTGGGRLLNLYFEPEFLDRLELFGLSPACVLASTVYTLATFLPGVGGVRVFTGTSMLTSLYSAETGAMSFEDGIMRRRAFQSFLRDEALIYTTDGTLLHPENRLVPAGSAGSPHSLLQLLCTDGPEYRSALPFDLGADDLLGLGLEGDTLLMNLSEKARSGFASLDFAHQQLAVYSMVLTFCSATGTRRLRLFFDGDVLDSLGTELYFGGEFLLNHVLVDSNRG